MSRSLFPLAIVLACAACCTMTGFARSQQPTLQLKDTPREDPAKVREFLIESLKLDPVITNAFKPDPNDSPLRKLQKERCRERVIYWAVIHDWLNTTGRWTPQDFPALLLNTKALSENLLEVMEKPEDKLKCYELRTDFSKFFEKFTDTRVKEGTDPSQNLNFARVARIEAEIELLKFITARKLPWERPKPAAPAQKDPGEDLLAKLDPFIANTIKPDPNDSTLRTLQKELCRQRAIYLAKMETLLSIGKITPQDFLDFHKNSSTLSMNLSELLDSPADKLKCYEMGLDALKLMEKYVETRVAIGTDPLQNLNLARADRIDAEIDLLKFMTARKLPWERPKPTAPAQKDPNENLLSKLDPFIINAFKPDPNDTLLRKLQKERCREITLYVAYVEPLIAIGKWNPEDFLDYCKIWSKLFVNLRDVLDSPADKLKCYKMALDHLKNVETIVENGITAGQYLSKNQNLVRADRIDADIELLEFKTTMERPKK